MASGKVSLLSRADPHLATIRAVGHGLKAVDGEQARQLENARHWLLQGLAADDLASCRDWLNAVEACCAVLDPAHAAKPRLDYALAQLRGLLELAPAKGAAS